jgi:predicted Zn-dependent protease
MTQGPEVTDGSRPVRRGKNGTAFALAARFRQDKAGSQSSYHRAFRRTIYLLGRARRTAREDGFRGVLRACRSVLRKERKHLEAGLQSASALIEQKRFDEAEDILRALAAQNPDGVSVSRKRAMLELRRGNDTTALRHARRAFELAPNDHAVGQVLIQALIRNGHYDEALAAIERMPQDRPIWPNTKRLIVEMLLSAELQRPLHEARRDDVADVPRRVRIALELAANDYTASRFCAEALTRNGFYEEAILVLERLLETQPGRSEIKRLIADIYLGAGRRKEAREWFLDVLNDDGGEPGATMRLARIETSLGRVETAEQLLEKVDIERVNHPGQIGPLALMEHDSGNYDIACRLWRKALDLEPDKTKWAMGLVSSLIRSGNFEEAMRLTEETARRADAHNWVLSPLHELQVVASRDPGISDDIPERLAALRRQLLARAPDPGIQELLIRTRGKLMEMRAMIGHELAGGAGGPKVTFICPLHRPKDLPNLAAQIARQNVGNYEAIVAIHSPHIEAEAVRAQWAASGSLKVIDCSSLRALGAVLNAALDESSGDLIMKIDADDTYFPNYAGDMCLSLIHTGTDVVAKGSIFRYLADRDLLCLSRPDYIYERATHDRFAGGSAICGWKRVFDLVRFDEDLVRGEDDDFHARCHQFSLKVHFVDPYNHVLRRSSDLGVHTWKADDLLMSLADRGQFVVGDSSALAMAEV